MCITSYFVVTLVVSVTFQEGLALSNFPKYPVNNHWCNPKTPILNKKQLTSILNEKSMFKCKCTASRFTCLDLSVTHHFKKYPSKVVVIESNGGNSWYMKCGIGSNDVLMQVLLRPLSLDKVNALNINDCRTESYLNLLSYLGINSIDKLVVRHRNVVSELNESSFRDISTTYPMLKGLELHSEGFTSISGNALSHLTSLTTLRIHRTSITSFPEALLFPLLNLREISVFWNRDLSGLPPNLFQKNIKLEKILINNNHCLTDLNKEQFNGLQNLSELDLGSNQFETIPNDLFSCERQSDFSKLTSFTMLDDSCGINCYRNMPSNLLEPLKNLMSFRYSGKYAVKGVKGRKVFATNFVVPATVTTLRINRANLNQNDLISILLNKDKIEKLDLSENEIQTIGPNLIPSFVKSVWLARNSLACDCETIQNLKQLMDVKRVLEDGFLITLNCSKQDLNGKRARELTSHQNNKYFEYYDSYEYLSIHEADEEFCLTYRSGKEEMSKIEITAGTVFKMYGMYIALIVTLASTVGLILGLILKYGRPLLCMMKQCWRKCNLTKSSKNEYEEY